MPQFSKRKHTGIIEYKISKNIGLLKFALAENCYTSNIWLA